MLPSHRVHPTLPASDLERARRFYEEALGFTTRLVSPAGIQYQAAETTWFTVYPSSSAGTNQATAMGFTVEDMPAEIAELRAKGVEILEYDFPTFKTENGIARTPFGYASWFKDTEGNTIGLVQFHER